MIATGISTAITGKVWDKYQHSFGGTATPGAVSEINFDTDMMRLATGGGAAV
jgi:FMN reductase